MKPTNTPEGKKILRISKGDRVRVTMGPKEEPFYTREGIIEFINYNYVGYDGVYKMDDGTLRAFDTSVNSIEKI